MRSCRYCWTIRNHYGDIIIERDDVPISDSELGEIVPCSGCQNPGCAPDFQYFWTRPGRCRATILSNTELIVMYLLTIYDHRTPVVDDRNALRLLKMLSLLSLPNLGILSIPCTKKRTSVNALHNSGDAIEFRSRARDIGSIVRFREIVCRQCQLHVGIEHNMGENRPNFSRCGQLHSFGDMNGQK